MNYRWNQERKALFETEAGATFSQHSNSLAILTNAIPLEHQLATMNTLLADTSFVQCSIYYKFYLLRALKKVGLGDQYLDQLEEWDHALSEGLTTFPETIVNFYPELPPNTSRSDCHAWSAYPIYDFLYTVCGIEPGSAGFETVIIKPNLGKLKQVKGSIPHPKGTIEIDLRRKGTQGIEGQVKLPDSLNGKFVWKDAVIELHQGLQEIDVE